MTTISQTNRDGFEENLLVLKTRYIKQLQLLNSTLSSATIYSCYFLLMFSEVRVSQRQWWQNIRHLLWVQSLQKTPLSVDRPESYSVFLCTLYREPISLRYITFTTVFVKYCIWISSLQIDDHNFHARSNYNHYGRVTCVLRNVWSPAKLIIVCWTAYPGSRLRKHQNSGYPPTRTSHTENVSMPWCHLGYQALKLRLTVSFRSSTPVCQSRKAAF